MKTTHRAHIFATRKVPPIAPVDSLLELLQLAKQRTFKTAGGSTAQAKAHDLCMAAAAAHGELLASVRGREGLRSFVLNSDAPWDGLWRQIAPVIGVPVDAPERKQPSTLAHLR